MPNFLVDVKTLRTIVRQTKAMGNYDRAMEIMLGWAEAAEAEIIMLKGQVAKLSDKPKDTDGHGL